MYRKETYKIGSKMVRRGRVPQITKCICLKFALGRKLEGKKEDFSVDLLVIQFMFYLPLEAKVNRFFSQKKDIFSQF